MKLFCDNFLLCTTRCYKNQTTHASMVISSKINISHKAITASICMKQTVRQFKHSASMSQQLIPE